MQHQKSQPKQTAQRKPAETAQQANHEPQAPQVDMSQLSSQSVLQLQRHVGNAKVARMVQARNVRQRQPNGTIQRLPQNLSGSMQVLFGDVANQAEIRTDAEANQIARQANADATTIDNVIYFRDGAYQPGTAEGNALIARQMTHVAQNQISRKPKTAQDQEEAQEIGGLVQDMGAEPAQVLQRTAVQNFTPPQMKVAQRLDKARVGGIVLSKALQGVGNLLGPIGILWRWPLIRKNIREYTNTSPTPNEKDQARYGDGKMADLARFLATFAEVLKEATLWMGFATFIAAIVAAATQGAAAVAFAILAIMTAMLAGVGALVKIYLVGHNLVRLAMAKSGSDTKMIRHQLWIDGFDALAAVITAVTSALGAVGAVAKVAGDTVNFSGSAGSAFSKGVDVGGSGGVVLGKVMNDTLFSPGMGAPINTFKEGGKDSTKKPDYVKKPEEKGFKGGLLKDYNEIMGAYGKDNLKYTGKKKDSGGSNDPSPKQQQDVETVSTQLKDIVNAGNANVTGQQQVKENTDAVPDLIQDKLGGVSDLSTKNQEIGEGMKETSQSGEKADTIVDNNVDNMTDENQIKETQKKVNEGLVKAEEEPIKQDDDKQETGELTKSNRKPGVFGRVKSWFAKKLGKIKAGIRRLNKKITLGAMKFVSKFTGKAGDAKEAGNIVNNNLIIAQQDKVREGENLIKAQEFSKQAAAASETFEKAKQEEA